MTIDNFINFFQINLLIKITFLIFNFLFVIFLFVVVKQVFSMNTIVSDDYDFAFLKFSAISLFIVAVSLFLISLVIL